MLKLPCDIMFYYRYVDDTLICLPENKVEDIRCRFNYIDKNLKFTIEISVNNNINFLDLDIHIINNKIRINWYRKPIWSGLYVNFLSHHSLSHKIGIIYSLTDRAILQIIFTIQNTLKLKFFQHLKIKFRKNVNLISFTKLIASSVIKIYWTNLSFPTQ